jgi:hypothetical protein
LFFACLVFLGACASLSRDDRHQYVLLQSEPSGAQVIENDKVIAQTPVFLDQRRSFSPELKLTYKDMSQNVKLSTRYDWGHSFWPNLMFFYFAPIGWLTDIITGAAWNLKDPPVVRFQSKTNINYESQNVVAIAPPKASSKVMSDKAALFWETKTSQMFKGAKFLSYHDTKDYFFKHLYNHEQRPGREDEYSIFGKIKNEWVFESEVLEKKEKNILKGTFRNVFTGEKKYPQELEVYDHDLSKSKKIPWYARDDGVFQFVPNTLSFDLGSNGVELESGSEVYKAKPSNTLNEWQKMLSIVKSFGITRLQTLYHESGYHWQFHFVPALMFSYSQIYFPELNPINDQSFKYFQLGAGYGAQLGLQNGAHFFYISIIPILSYYKLKWSTWGTSHKITQTVINSRSELGYLYFWTHHFGTRLYTKASSMPSSMWNKAFATVAPNVPKISNGFDLSAGLSLSYTFD